MAFRKVLHLQSLAKKVLKGCFSNRKSRLDACVFNPKENFSFPFQAKKKSRLEKRGVFSNLDFSHLKYNLQPFAPVRMPVKQVYDLF